MKRKQTYKKYVYEVRQDTTVHATFCLETDAKEYANKYGMTVYKIGAIK